jgi:hypothetical protein
VKILAESSIERLTIAHWPDPLAVPPAAIADVFVVATCQRRMLIAADRELARSVAALAPPELYSGPGAYAFLLEVAAGLRSAVPGESNVFGQFKRAWDSHRRIARSAAVEALTPVIEQVIRDTRAIRREYLQGVGGASYGGLVRRLLRAAAGDHVLVIGAGDLARSILPFLRPCEIGIWSRRFLADSFAAADRIFMPQDAALASGWAHHVVFTTPADDINDGEWSRRFACGPARSIVHLGRRRSRPFAWPARLVTHDLDDVFDLRRSHHNVRSLRVERARLACRERSRRVARPGSAPDRCVAAG